MTMYRLSVHQSGELPDIYEYPHVDPPIDSELHKRRWEWEVRELLEAFPQFSLIALENDSYIEQYLTPRFIYSKNGVVPLYGPPSNAIKVPVFVGNLPFLLEGRPFIEMVKRRIGQKCMEPVKRLFVKSPNGAVLLLPICISPFNNTNNLLNLPDVIMSASLWDLLQIPREHTYNHGEIFRFCCYHPSAGVKSMTEIVRDRVIPHVLISIMFSELNYVNPEKLRAFYTKEQTTAHDLFNHIGKEDSQLMLKFHTMYKEVMRGK